MKVTNKTESPRGIWSKSGLVFVAANDSRDVDLTPEQAEQVGKIDGMEVDSSKAKADTKPEAKPENKSKPEDKQ